MKEIDLILVSEEYEVDAIGQRTPVEKQRTVPALEDAITRREWSAAGQNGIRAEKVVLTSAINYDDEKIVIIDGVRYMVYRNYIKPGADDEIELYLRKEVS